MTFEDRFYSSTHPLWNNLSAKEKTEILEHARYYTYTGSRWNNLLLVFYFFVGMPVLIGIFIALPFLYLWQSIFVAPIGVLFINYVGGAIHRHIHAKLMRPAVSRLLEERAGPNRN